MRISDVIHMALDSMGAVLIFGFLLFLGWLMGYKLCYQKLLKGTKTIKIKKPALWAIFFCYIVVVLSATMLNRAYATWGIELTPFASYRQAWNGFSPQLWRNILLNIAMFIPFGFFLPILFEKCQKALVTYMSGLGFTLFIEATQLVTGRGIFEADDIINNALGAAIGFGVYQIAYAFWSMWKKKSLHKKTLWLAQIPLILTVLVFCGIFLFYHKKELGNLSFAYTHRVNMAKVQVELQANLQENIEEAAVYQLHIASIDETRQIAENFFAGIGTGIDDSQTDIYDETIIYRSSDGNSALWIDYQGCIMEYTNYAQFGNQGLEEQVKMLEDATRQEVEEILQKVQIDVINKAEFKKVESGIYLFKAEKEVDEDALYHGELRVEMNENGEILNLRHGLVEYRYQKTYPIRSEKEAYDDFLAGKFQAGWKQDFSRVVVKDVNLQYWTDTKGYFQPVYAFQVSLDGAEGIIYLQAIK